MTHHYHALVWIDHSDAKIFHFNAEEVEATTIRSHHAHEHIHHKANTRGSGHAAVDKEFLKRVVQELTSAGAILITGPANAKTELADYIKQEQPQLFERISAVESSDHPTDGELLAHGRKFFKADDRMHSQVPN